MVEGKYRFYFKKGSEDFIDFTQSQIASIETVPDPPPEPVAESVKAAPPPTPALAKPVEVKLTSSDLHQMLASAGTAHNVDEDLLASVVKAESNGNAHAVSPKGAQGLMQLMPGTAAEQGVQDAFRPADNVRGGAGYLDWLLQRYHDNLALALAAYNAGPGAVDKYHGMPPYRETKLYVARVIHEFNRRVKERERQAAQTRAQAAVTSR
ncbi:lytic transglycosylase domain-containing protein [Acidobacteria bacterium AB60]|nr:lytic transglycosylase domain-containing protein [Acidobacteria bacterium AB60]